MEIEVILAMAMFACAILALMGGFPVALTLGGVALVFALIGIALGVFPEAFLKGFPARIQGSMENQVLIAVPLFVIMGVVLERSRVAEDLLHIAGRLLSSVRGGLGYAVIIVGALLAASTGIVGATVITMTLIALPTMMQQGYSPKLASGTIAAAGTLGQIIPPSIVLILLADAISNANQSASLSGGVGPSVVSVGDLFAGALVPGLLLVTVYLAFIALTALLRPTDCPAPVEAEFESRLTFGEIASGLGAPLLLIIVVLGSILGGVASPTEAAAVGAAGAILLAGLRLSPSIKRGGLFRAIITVGLICLILLLLLSNAMDLRISRAEIPLGEAIGIAAAALASLVFLASLFAGLMVLYRADQFKASFKSASHITAMVFLILIGASLFALVFRGFGGDDFVAEFLASVPGGKWGALAITMLVMFVLGFFLDFIEIVFVVVPLVAPPLIIMGFDPIWLAILMALNLQTSFLTPPFGFALFYLRGAASDSIATADIWRGAIAFIGLQLLMIALVAAIPSLATWLPAIAAR
ncbi:MAG: TRAP transporter large permease subunit [Pseudomonadota bacterium]